MRELQQLLRGNVLLERHLMMTLGLATARGKAVVGGLCVAVLIAGSWLFFGRSQAAPAGGPPTFSVLNGPRDTLAPDILQREGFQRDFGASPDIRLALKRPGVTYDVAKDTKGEICLIKLYDDAIKTVAYTCGDPSAFTLRPLVIFSASAGGWDLAGLVPDGFTKASAGGASASVVNDVFVMPHVPLASPLDVTGPNSHLHVEAGTPEAPPRG